MATVIGLADRAAGHAFVRGGLVCMLQRSLRDRGHFGARVDGVYGPATAQALIRWQRGAGRPATGHVDAADWVALCGAMPGPFDLALQITAAFEGHGFGLAQGNWDGALLTWGIIGFTLRHGEFTRLFTDIDTAAPGLVDRALGPALAPTLRGLLGADPESDRAAMARTVATMSVRPGGAALLPEWRDAFARLGDEPVVQRLQIERARAVYWARAVKDAARHSLTGPLGLALAFDIAVQNGGISRDEAAEIDRLLALEPAAGAQRRREIVADVVAENSLDRFVEDVRSRKRCIATGAGRVHGASYDLALWGLHDEGAAAAVPRPAISAPPFPPHPCPAPACPFAPAQAPATPEPPIPTVPTCPVCGAPSISAGHGVAPATGAPALAPAAGAPLMPPPPVVPPLIASAAAAGTPEARFAAFMAGLRLRHFAPGEFLFLGASHGARPPNERNSLPPESLWPAIVPVARLLDTLREEMGAPIRLLSIYRSPAYNAAIGGAKASQHLRFTAADFTCADGRRPEDWAARLRAHRRAGVFHGGIGVYPAKGFVHVDARGHDVDF